jgi:uncharacterized DUF497 family protein
VVIEFDPTKSEANRGKRGLPFSLVENFDFTTAQIVTDNRRDYGETRMQALGMLGDMLAFLCFKPIPEGIRVISLRKASRKERAQWFANQTLP